MADTISTGISLDLRPESELLEKPGQVDLDTVSTNATTSNTFSGSDDASGDANSGDEEIAVCVPCGEVKEKPAESTEAKAKKTGKAERRNRRSSRLGTNTMLYTKAMYKRRFCAHYPDVDKCKRGSQCAFAHSRAEFRGSLLPADEEHEGAHSDDFYMNRYKTMWCPIGVQHDWQNCVYAHNYLDIRRCPEIGYGPRQCPHWDKSNSKTAYGERCPNGVRCPYAHGAKEQLYHPAHFKTVVCWDMMSPEGCPRSHLCAFHHDKEECRVEITKDMEFDYTKPLEGKQMKSLQKDFNTPPPIGTDLEPAKPAPQQKKAPVLPAPVAPAAPAQPAPAPQVPVMLMMMPPGLPHGALPGMPAGLPHGALPQVPFMQVMHPQMIAGGSPQAGGPPGVMMMMPQMQMAAAGGVRPDGAMAQDPQGPALMSLPVSADPHQYGAPVFGMQDARELPHGAYPRSPQEYHSNAASSPTFRDLCSPTYQSSESYAQYVRDIMNADGDEFQFA